MSDKNSIKEAIEAMATDTKCYSVVCTVASVDGDLCDCSPVNGDADLLDVRLQAQTATGILITPVIDSVVVVTLIDKNTGFVSMFSEVESIELNGSNYDGLVRVAELTTKLNNLENKMNLVLAFLTTLGGVPPLTTPLVTTIQTELENLTILHGNG